MAFKKKLYRYRPDAHPPQIEIHRTKTLSRREPCDPLHLERGVRQWLADKISGSLVGLWLLIPEHLRLGTWDLLCRWTGRSGDRVEPRLALQLVSEAALCLTHMRQHRCLSQKGFELAHGLPFVASDPAIHELLEAHTVADSEALQVALGRLRHASGHYRGDLLVIDPHRIRSYSRRHMRRRACNHDSDPVKAAQTFFCLDPATQQPLCFTTATAARTAAQATPRLLEMAQHILNPPPGKILVLADTEHFVADLVAHVRRHTPFHLLVPLPNQPRLRPRIEAVPDERFTPHWAGFATAQTRYRFTDPNVPPAHLFIQRSGERPEQYHRKGFLSTCRRNVVQALTRDFPDRWHVEEFFNAHQALGWHRAGTLNLNIRYGHMTMALLAQAALHQLRQRLGPPMDQWVAPHLATHLLSGLDGDIRVHRDTILVTFYNAPNVELLRAHFHALPRRLEKENVDPRIPWLYNFKLDFRFK